MYVFYIDPSEPLLKEISGSRKWGKLAANNGEIWERFDKGERYVPGDRARQAIGRRARNERGQVRSAIQFPYGAPGPGWQAIAGDWDGDGTDTIGLYDPSAGVFYLRNSNTDGPADEQFGYGPAGLGWEPVAGDWDGNGTTTVGLYDATTSISYLRNAHGGGPADLQFLFGPPLDGYAAVAGDWNGDGTGTIGLYRASRAEKKYYYTRDHLGSVRAVWTAAGAQVASYTYDEWGVTTSGINQVESPIGYAGCGTSGVD